MSEATSREVPGPRVHRRRLRVLVAAFVLLAVVYAGRGTYLQVIRSDHWRQIARDQHSQQIQLPAERGAILDRHGRPLATDAQEFRAYLAPGELRDRERAVEAATRVLGLRPREARHLRDAENGWVAIPRRVSAEDRDRLARAIRRGLHFERLTSRSHPEGDVARALLGNIEPSGQGRSGLEMALDSVLRGKAGVALGRRDALGETYRLPGGEVEPPRPGHDVVLTLDLELQTIAENALEHGLAQTGASGGDILLLDPRSGEILGLASRRGTDVSTVPAITDAYEPGSTAKPFLLATLLASGAARLDDTVYAEAGVYRTRHGRLVRDVHPYDSLSVADVVRLSSNIGAVKLAHSLDPALQYRYLRDFGFGMPSGLLYPSESGGRLRRPDAWSGLSQGSLAMGYELAVTSVQLAAAYGALANGGQLMRPHLVREIRSATGRVVWRREPEVVRRVVPEEVAAAVTRVLTAVVDSGTATRAAMSTLPMAGKTGTARLASNGGYREARYAASFVGYTPAHDPRLLVLTRLQDPQGYYYGGLTAAPVSRAALEAALASRGELLREPPHARQLARRVEWTPPGPRPASAVETAGRSGSRYVFAAGGGAASPTARPGEERSSRRIVPDLRGLTVRAAVARLHRLGLHVELRAAGSVRGQVPGPGALTEPGDTIVLR